MGLFKRAGWHSGLTYRQTCDQCKTEITYKDDKLDFRPWFADGFIYCPVCQKPLRHSETYAIDTQTTFQSVDLTASVEVCSNCGAAYRDGDKFCSQCGNKR